MGSASTWEWIKFQNKTPEKPRDVNMQATRKRDTLQTNIHIPTPSLSKLVIGKSEKERKKMAGSRNLLLKQPQEMRP